MRQRTIVFYFRIKLAFLKHDSIQSMLYLSAIPLQLLFKVGVCTLNSKPKYDMLFVCTKYLVMKDDKIYISISSNSRPKYSFTPLILLRRPCWLVHHNTTIYSETEWPSWVSRYLSIALNLIKRSHHNPCSAVSCSYLICVRDTRQGAALLSVSLLSTAIWSKYVTVIACRLLNALPGNTNKCARFGAEVRDVVRQGLWW